MAVVQERIHLPEGQSFRLLRWHDNLREVDLIISPQRSVRIAGEGEHWHYHEALELTFFETGDGTRFIGDQIQRFECGDLVLLGENLPHYWHARGRSSGWSVQWHLPPTHHFWVFPETVELSNFFEGAARGIQIRGASAQWLSAQFPQIAATQGLERLGLLFRLFSSAASAPRRDLAYVSKNSFSLSVESRHQAAMQAAIRFLLANFRMEIRLQEILAISRMSKPTFSRQFKKHSGKTMSEFLQQIRLDAACRDLAETDRPVIDVALGSGFSQISFFNRVFRRAFKCSPLDYRRQQRSGGPGEPAAAHGANGGAAETIGA